MTIMMDQMYEESVKEYPRVSESVWKCLRVNFMKSVLHCFLIYNLWQHVEQECQLALGQIRQAVIQKKTLQ